LSGVRIVEIDREYLKGRLTELKDWADYLHLSLTLDQPHEPGKLRLLEALASREELEKLRFELRTVRYRLENMAANLTPGTEPPRSR
jgi:hypothetical protein